MSNLGLFCIIFVLLFCECCSEKKVRLVKDGVLIEGHISITNNDTILNGLIKFKNINGNTLIAIANYENNMRNGVSTEFYKNGRIYSNSNFINDQLHGEVFIYDTSGNQIYRKYYYYGLHVGPVLEYEYDKIKSYHFETFEGAYLYKCTYDSSKVVKEQGSLLNYISRYESDDEGIKLAVFLYLISPPKKRVTYKLYDKDLSRGDSTLVFSWFADSIPFKEFILDNQKMNHEYLWDVEEFYNEQNLTIHNVIEEERRLFTLPYKKGN